MNYFIIGGVCLLISLVFFCLYMRGWGYRVRFGFEGPLSFVSPAKSKKSEQDNLSLHAFGFFLISVITIILYFLE